MPFVALMSNVEIYKTNKTKLELDILNKIMYSYFINNYTFFLSATTF